MRASFDRLVKGGRPELVLVSGYSGIGKSAVVNELHRLLVPPCGLFTSGKFDQYKRDISYRTIAQTFQGLIRAFMSKSDAELEGWRGALSEALGAHRRLVVELILELKLIIGEQPPATGSRSVFDKRECPRSAAGVAPPLCPLDSGEHDPG